MNTTVVFDKNQAAILEGRRIIVNQGGTSSSKTWSILQLLYIIAFSSKKSLLISIVGPTMPHIRKGSLRDFLRILQEENVYREEDHNKTSISFRINKSTI